MPCWEVRRISLDMSVACLDTLEKGLKEVGFTTSRVGTTITFNHSQYGSGTYSSGSLEVDRNSTAAIVKKAYTKAQFKRQGTRFGYKIRTTAQGKTQLYRRNYGRS